MHQIYKCIRYINDIKYMEHINYNNSNNISIILVLICFYINILSIHYHTRI